MNIFTGTSAPTNYRDIGKLGLVRMTEIGGLIRRARTAKRMSRRMLSEMTGVAKSTIQEVEKGTGNPAFEIVAKLAQAVNVHISAYASDLPRHSAPIDSSGIAQNPPLSSLQAEQVGGISALQKAKSPGGVMDGTDTGSTAEIVAALDARLSRFEHEFNGIAERLRRSMDALDENVWTVHALAEDFSEQAANLRTEPDPTQHAAAGALGAGVSQVPGQHLQQVGGKSHRKKRTPPPPTDHDTTPE